MERCARRRRAGTRGNFPRIRSPRQILRWVADMQPATLHEHLRRVRRRMVGRGTLDEKRTRVTWGFNGGGLRESSRPTSETFKSIFEHLRHQQNCVVKHIILIDPHHHHRHRHHHPSHHPHRIGVSIIVIYVCADVFGSCLKNDECLLKPTLAAK